MIDAIGKSILSNSLSLYMWGKHAKTRRYIPKEHIHNYVDVTKQLIYQQGSDQNRDALSVIKRYQKEWSSEYNEIMSRKGLSDKERMRECERRFNSLKDNVSNKRDIPIWCSAALSAFEGIGNIFRIPFMPSIYEITKNIFPRKNMFGTPDKNDNRIMIVGDRHNDFKYLAALRKKIKDAMDDPRNKDNKIIVLTEYINIFDDCVIAKQEKSLKDTDEALKEINDFPHKGIEYFYDRIADHIGKENIHFLNLAFGARYPDKNFAEAIELMVQKTQIFNKNKSLARGILEAVDRSHLKENMTKYDERIALEKLLKEHFTPINTDYSVAKDNAAALDNFRNVLAYNDMKENIDFYNQVKSDKRMVFDRTDKKQHDITNPFETCMCYIKLILGNPSLEEDDFINIKNIFDNMFTDIVDEKIVPLEKPILDNGLKEGHTPLDFKEHFQNMRSALNDRNEKEFRREFNDLSRDPEYMSLVSNSYIRSMSMLEHARSCAMKNPDAQIIMFMGKSHLYDLQKKAPHANFCEHYDYLRVKD